jgi:hypothetical protein
LLAINAGTVVVNFLSSTQNQLDDFTWGTKGLNAGKVTLAYADTPPLVYGVSLVTDPAASPATYLMRYVRWSATLSGGATSATFAITGMGRRKGS